MTVTIWLFLLLVTLSWTSSGASPALPDYDIWGEDPRKILHNVVEGGNNIHSAESAKAKDQAINSKDKGRKGKILSFFTYTDEDECKANDGRRSGLCLNAYSCRRRGGTSSGYCAHGFGVCCVFTVSCGSEIKNNLTYFISPEFPSISRSLASCNLFLKKTEGVSQLRLDFLHFNLGQPNRATGDCDSDVFSIVGGTSKFKLCGQNSGQHVYYDVDKNSGVVTFDMRLSRPTVNRLWEIRIAQIPFSSRAPDGCMQYFTTKRGMIQTLNFAENGRHLANQDYKACVRQARGMCSIAYEPCDDNSFKIGPNAALAAQMAAQEGGGGPGGMGGAGTEYLSTNQVPVSTSEDADVLDADGSGDGINPVPDVPNQVRANDFEVYSPYAQHLGANLNMRNGSSELWRYWGYGNYGQGVSSFGRQRCQDRIITPCDGDEFLATNPYSPGVCDPYHCGFHFCPETKSNPKMRCRVETSSKPFAVGVKFGPPSPKSSPEDNIGACLKFEQIPCST